MADSVKKKGKNSCYFFTQDKYKQFIRRREIRVELQNAVDHNFKNFDVYYQPIIDIHTRNLIGAEALMRFKMKRNEQIEFISPAEFIPILASNDEGETPKKGGLLIAKHGKGNYIYTGLSFFRELPEGVSGAYRLMANLIALDK